MTTQDIYTLSTSKVVRLCEEDFKTTMGKNISARMAINFFWILSKSANFIILIYSNGNELNLLKFIWQDESVD